MPLLLRRLAHSAFRSSAEALRVPPCVRCSSSHVSPASAAPASGSQSPSTLPKSSTAPRSEPSTSTHFGFRTVPLSDKQAMVGNVFSRVAGRYDVMNDVMSLFTHRLWKDVFVSNLSPTRPIAVLDCAGGTGDVAFRVHSALRETGNQCHPVTVCDVNKDMLEVGRAKALKQNLTDGDIRFVHGNAENLPFEDGVFDVYMISFGMRNVPRPRVAVQEALRVLKPGGRFLMLEFAAVRNQSLKAAYEAYSFNLIPALGQLVANDREAYQYLVESIQQFPNQQQFCDILREEGFRHVSSSDYTFGIAACYSAFKAATKAQ